MFERAGRGRCVIATRDLSPGHELFTEIPYAFAFLNTAEKYCYLCTRQVCRDKNTQVNICPSCKITTYCSVECYNKDRVSHSQICSLICEARHIASKHDADAKILELLLKIFSKKYFQGSTENAEDESAAKNDSYPLESTFEDVVKMIDHLEFCDKKWTASVQGAIDDLLCHINASKHPLGSVFDRDLALRIAAKINANSHAINTRKVNLSDGRFCGIDERDIGVGMFPNLALLNHSCFPNVLYYGVQPADSGMYASVRVKVCRPAKKGEELCISYIDVYQSRKKRLQELLATKRFLHLRTLQ